MRAYHYRVTLEKLEESPASAQFEFDNHDDLFEIINRLKQRGDLLPEDAAPFALGLKLFGHILMKNGQQPLFSSIKPHFSTFMKTLKQNA